MAEEKTFSVGVQTSSPTRINVTSNVSENPITASADTGLYYSQLAKNWAIGEGLIQNEDYSSKTWAGESKASADLSKMYSEAASLDLENLENKISIYDEQLNTTLAEGLDSISSAVTSGVGEIDTSKLNVLAQIEDVVNTSIEDINATGIDTKVSKSGDTMTGYLLGVTPPLSDNSTKTATTEFCDGNWVNKYFRIANEVEIAPGATKTYSLSSYLPNDGNLYEVIVSGYGKTQPSTGSALFLSFKSDFITRDVMLLHTYASSNYKRHAAFSFTTISSTGRSITVSSGSNSVNNGVFDLRVHAYRRVR